MEKKNKPDDEPIRIGDFSEIFDMPQGVKIRVLPEEEAEEIRRRAARPYPNIPRLVVMHGKPK